MTISQKHRNPGEDIKPEARTVGRVGCRHLPTSETFGGPGGAAANLRG